MLLRHYLQTARELFFELLARVVFMQENGKSGHLAVRLVGYSQIIVDAMIDPARHLLAADYYENIPASPNPLDLVLDW